jgi:hypothetical protein
MEFNATFNNISITSWRLISLRLGFRKKILSVLHQRDYVAVSFIGGGPGENHQSQEL